MSFTPKAPLLKLFSSLVEFDASNEVELQLQDACAKYGMNFIAGRDNEIAATGELFVLSVWGEIDYTGVVAEGHPMFKAVFTTFSPHTVLNTEWFHTVDNALSALALMMSQQAEPIKPQMRRKEKQ